MQRHPTKINLVNGNEWGTRQGITVNLVYQFSLVKVMCTAHGVNATGLLPFNPVERQMAPLSLMLYCNIYVVFFGKFKHLLNINNSSLIFS